MIYSFIKKPIEEVKPNTLATGVTRFDSLLRRIFPEMVSVSELPELNADDVIITDNHMSLDVLHWNKAVVVHHGCAATHYERDPGWQNAYNREMVEKQKAMFALPNRTFVAVSIWVKAEFGNRDDTVVIPNWVEPIVTLDKPEKPMIIGDWRDGNKGRGIWKQLAKECPEWDFAPLDFADDVGRRLQYGKASLYLCLSLSEGGPYAVADAEAAGLPIVTTDVGNYLEFDDCEVIRWQDRSDIQAVKSAIAHKLESGRQKPSFYRTYTLRKWSKLWQETIT